MGDVNNTKQSLLHFFGLQNISDNFKFLAIFGCGFFIGQNWNRIKVITQKKEDVSQTTSTVQVSSKIQAKTVSNENNMVSYT